MAATRLFSGVSEQWIRRRWAHKHERALSHALKITCTKYCTCAASPAVAHINTHDKPSTVKSKLLFSLEANKPIFPWASVLRSWVCHPDIHLDCTVVHSQFFFSVISSTGKKQKKITCVFALALNRQSICMVPLQVCPISCSLTALSCFQTSRISGLQPAGCCYTVKNNVVQTAASSDGGRHPGGHRIFEGIQICCVMLSQRNC